MEGERDLPASSCRHSPLGNLSNDLRRWRADSVTKLVCNSLIVDLKEGEERWRESGEIRSATRKKRRSTHHAATKHTLGMRL